jgi:hypothetical protein
LAHDEEPRAAPEDERAEGKGEGDEAGRAVEEEAESLCADVSERDEGVPDKVAEGDGAEPLFGDGLAVERVDCELQRGVAEEVDGDGRRDKGVDPADLRECVRVQRSPGVEVGRESVCGCSPCAGPSRRASCVPWGSTFRTRAD